ncbi:DUF1697 domain-containing protein [Microbacterium lacus]|uniref:DUF1697 domain-containing protein n=1 Tax=Microbacterium lacus TaxID=415217 RepID=UPI00384B9CCC
MQHVAFFRNVNQGQRGHPSTADLVGAFAAAGCPDAVPFQSNGTLVFAATDPEAVLPHAIIALADRTGLEREGFGMPLPALARIVDAHAGEADARRRELTLHTGAIIDLSDPDVEREAAHRRCTVVHSGPGWGVFLNERDHESNGTAVVERLTGARATSRGIPTLVRLVDRFAGPVA